MPFIDKDHVELNFLRWLYANIGEYLGPADDQIYDDLKRSYIAEGNELPEDYQINEE